jgi:alkaline phosphatase D
MRIAYRPSFVRLLIISIGLLLMPKLSAQMGAVPAALRAMPMVGHLSFREARIWLQTTSAAEVQLVYMASTSTLGDSTPPVRHTSQIVNTSKDSAFCALFVLDSLEPGMTYIYQVVVNHEALTMPYATTFSTPKLWQYRGDPPPLKIALGSCAYVNDRPYDRPGPTFGDGYKIFGTIARQQPDIMLWMGDNLYFREADWDSRAGMIDRYSKTRRIAELQPLLATGSHYAIWDDHDYGPNDADGSFALKHEALRTFNLFWANPSPPQDLGAGITNTFERADAQFFLLDGRYHRSPNKRRTGTRSLLGDTQFEWLISALKASKATFKFVVIGGQVLNPLPKWETYQHYFPDERAKLIRALQDENIQGVIFLTGDRHQTELDILEVPNQAPLHDLTVSPLTAGPVPDSIVEQNPLRVEGTLVRERNFGLLEITGPRTDRKLTISILNADGQFIWQKIIEAKRLYTKPEER